MVQQKTLKNPGALSGRIEQSSKICSGASAHCMAGSKSDYDHYCRDLSCDLWKHPKSIHQFHQCRPGKDQTDLYTARNQVPCLDQSRPSGKRACDHQQHESQYRIVSGGRHHR